MTLRIILPQPQGSETNKVPQETSYVKALKAELLQYERDIIAARQNKVKQTSHICELILMYLETNGSRTLKRLCKDLCISKIVGRNVCNHLKRRDLIIESKTKRKDIVYTRRI